MLFKGRLRSQTTLGLCRFSEFCLMRSLDENVVSGGTNIPATKGYTAVQLLPDILKNR